MAIGLIGPQACNAAAPAASGLPAKLTANQARHLLVRTGFAPDQAEVNALTGLSAQQAVIEIVRKAEAASPLYPVPTFVARPPIPYKLLKSKGQLYATVAKDWWGINPDTVARGQFEPLTFLKT